MIALWRQRRPQKQIGGSSCIAVRTMRPTVAKWTLSYSAISLLAAEDRTGDPGGQAGVHSRGCAADPDPSRSGGGQLDRDGAAFPPPFLRLRGSGRYTGAARPDAGPELVAGRWSLPKVIGRWRDRRRAQAAHFPKPLYLMGFVILC